MTNDGVFLRIQWQDKCGLDWTVVFTEEPLKFSGFMAASQVRGTGEIHVQTHDTYSRKLSMACLRHVEISDRRLENRGMGSMLVGIAIEECKRRRYDGIEGYLSSVHGDHFTKLKHFYKKLGFSVVFYAEEHPDYHYDRVGKLEMNFNKIPTEPRING